MKNFVNFLCTTVLFVVLFYRQEALGFNLTLFCLMLLGFVIFNRTGKSKLNPWLVLAVITSALSFAWYADPLSFAALFLSMLAVSYHSKSRRIHSVLYPVFAAVNSVCFVGSVFMLKNWLPERLYKNYSVRRAMMLFVLPIAIAVIFLLVYIGSSDLMAEFVARFFHNFNLPMLIILTILGFTLMFCFWFKYLPKSILLFNQNLTNQFSHDVTIGMDTSKLSVERQSALTALTLINGLLVLFLVAYNYEQFFQSVKISELSADTHQRVGTVIFSIVLAIAVILFYFRRELNFDPKIGSTKKMVYIWIALNSLLVLSAFLKNGQYIIFYGLTFKRIAVMIFLILCWLGLLFTFFKIKNRKTNFYLVQTMLNIGFTFLIVLAPVNFSWIVTKYNLDFIEKPDFQYLQQLDYNHGILTKNADHTAWWKNYLQRVNDLKKNNLKEPLLSHRFYDYFY